MAFIYISDAQCSSFPPMILPRTLCSTVAWLNCWSHGSWTLMLQLEIYTYVSYMSLQHICSYSKPWN